MSTIDFPTGYPLAADSGGEILQCYGNAAFLVQTVSAPLFVQVLLSRNIKIYPHKCLFSTKCTVNIFK